MRWLTGLDHDCPLIPHSIHKLVLNVDHRQIASVTLESSTKLRFNRRLDETLVVQHSPEP